MFIINELNKQADTWTEQEAIDYILAHKDSFDIEDEVDVFLYNIALGTRYYPLEKYQEALVCLDAVTTLCDKYGEEIDFSSNPLLLIAYYWEAKCEFQLGTSRGIVLEKFQRAKAMFEKYDQYSSDYYKLILSDIEAIRDMDNLKNIPLAMDYFICKKHDETIPLLEQFISNYPKSRPREELFSWYHFLGLNYMAVGRLDDAEQLYIKALTELEEKHKAYRLICNDLGFLYIQVHNYQKASDYLGQSKWLHEKYMDFDNSYISCLSNAAISELNLGHKYMAKILIDVVLKYIRKGYCYNISEKFVNGLQTMTSISGTNINTTTLSDNANKEFQLRLYIQSLSNAAAIYGEAGFGDDAIICLKECLSMNEELGEQNGLAYNNMGCLYLFQSRISESLPYFSKAMTLCTTDYEKNDVLFNYALALWLLHSNDCSKIAIQTSESLINSIAGNFSFLSQEERFNYYKHFEIHLPFLNIMLYESGNENHYGYIYDNILTTKGLLLRAANGVKETIMRSGDEELISDYNQMIVLRQRILTEQDFVLRNDMVKEIEYLDKKLSRSAAGYGAFTKFNSINWKDILGSLNRDDIAIEFYNIPLIQKCDTLQKMTGEPRYCAVILKKDYQTPKIVPLCKESELNKLDEDSLYTTDGLYHLIWEPLESELKGVRNIYFSADRILHKIGVEYALLQNGRKIDDIYNIYRLSSTRIVAESHKNSMSKNAVLYGGLLYDLKVEQLIAESRSEEFHSEKISRVVGLSDLRYGVKYLPATKKEVEEIYKSFVVGKDAKCDIITDMAGTEESFKSLAGSSVDIIHLATHGFFWSEEEVEERNYINFLSNLNNKAQRFEDKALMRSGLFFSGANISLAGEELPDDVEDGVLTAQEISVMNLGNVDMVVLSACQSGLGETSSEGVFGLQRGFKLAGANTLLMSLWKVDDEATRILMIEFYKNYLSGKTKRESLHLAQQTLRKTHPDPEYWAAFILLDALN